MEAVVVDERRWRDAYEHALLARKEYSAIPMGALALNLVIMPAIRRYETGERTQELLEDLESIAL